MKTLDTGAQRSSPVNEQKGWKEAIVPPSIPCPMQLLRLFLICILYKTLIINRVFLVTSVSHSSKLSHLRQSWELQNLQPVRSASGPTAYSWHLKQGYSCEGLSFLWELKLTPGGSSASELYCSLLQLRQKQSILKFSCKPGKTVGGP